MSNFLDSIRQRIGDFRERTRDRAFVDIVMGGVALVARADGDVRLSELVARDRVLARLNELRLFDVREAVEAYEKQCRLLDRNLDGGRQQILDRLAEFEGDHEDRLTLVKACLAIGHADSDFSAPERSVVEQICHRLGLDPGDLGVYDI